MPERYRVGVIGRTGRGNYGHGHDEVWRDVPRTEVVAVADDDPDGLARTAKKIGAAAAYADYREMLDRERLDVVSVAPRWLDRHAELVLAAVEHGCHVWMEKPFCRDLTEADAIVRAVEMRHAKLAIAHQTRWTPTLDVVAREIKRGIIGRVLELRGRGKEDARRGGGEDLWVLGSHILDLMRVFAGDPRSCFATVTQKGQPIAAADVVDGPEGIGPLAGDAVNAMFTFSGGVSGYFSSHRGAGSGQTRFALQICGTNGIIEITTGHLNPCHVLQDPLWSPGRSGKEWAPITSNGVGQPETLTDPGLHGGNVLGVNDLLDCIEDPARQPRCNVYDARWTVEMIAAIFESQRAGGPVTLPLMERRNPLALLRGEGPEVRGQKSAVR